MIISTLRPTLTMLFLLTILFGGIYPTLATFLAQDLFPKQANASLIVDKEGKALGSELIGQQFTDNKYFWGRLSATSPQAYNASASVGSNLNPANPALLDAVKARIADLQKADPINKEPIPVDLVTASGSGLDPEISIAAANYQVARVAKSRGMSEDNVRSLVAKYTSQRQFGVLGEPRVNVLELNLALDGRM
ncbi:MAG: potassium-transporting ATPase subunit KdpC [Pseudomonadota bacterium]